MLLFGWLALSENSSGGANGPQNQTLRQLPSVEEVLRSPDGMALLSDHPRWAVVAAARAEIADRRAELRRQHGAASDIAAGVEIGGPALAARVSAFLRPSLRRVINATGVVLHTNLGRAPLAERALGARAGDRARLLQPRVRPERARAAGRVTHTSPTCWSS